MNIEKRVFEQDIESVRDFYSRPRVIEGESKSLYEIWEHGGALDDSVTPSTYCAEYQSHIFLKLQSLAPDGVIFSLGCGNAVIEGRLAQLPRRVKAIDCTSEAVMLARSKGVAAFEADFMSFPGHEIADAAVVYADGLIGHLFDPDEGLRPFVGRLSRLPLSAGTKLLVSNDAPRTAGVPFEPHDRLDGFWFVAHDYLANLLSDAGFGIVEQYRFPYLRPRSGLRNRTICVATVL